MTQTLEYAFDIPLWARECLSDGYTLDRWQSEVCGSNADTILNCCRQAGKSYVASVIVAHKIIFRPKTLALVISPTQAQAKELFRNVSRHIADMGLSQNLKEDNALSCKLDNHSRVLALPGTQALRGYSPQLVILDEAAQVPDIIHDAIRPMLAVSHGRLIMMSTPYGKRGFFFERYTNSNPLDGIERYEIPATRCDRITQEFLDKEKATMNPWMYRQEYECQFSDTIDSFFDSSLVEAALDYSIRPLFPSPQIEGVRRL